MRYTVLTRFRLGRPQSNPVGRRSRVAVLAGVLVTLTAVVTTSTPVTALAGSDFEETDGNLVAETKDWESFADKIDCATNTGCAVDRTSGSSDDALGQGAKDDSSTVNVVTGSIPNNKSDLERFYSVSETIRVPKAGGGTEPNAFFYFAWVRNNTLGTANFSIEANQVASTGIPTPGSSYTIDRRPGDLLILFDFAKGGKKIELGLSEWKISGNPKTTCQASSSLPCWGKIRDLDATGAANGSVNTAGFGTNLATSDLLFGGAPLADATFGEAAVNLTKAGVLTDLCKGFGQVMIRSRSSSAFNAELKDFIVPTQVSVTLPVDVTKWKSSGKAVTATVFDSQLVNPAQDLGPVAQSSQTGPGTNQQTPPPAPVDVPASDLPDDGNPLTPPPPKKGEVVHADLLGASAISVVTADPPLTTQKSSAIAAGVNILKGTVTADVVQAFANTAADKDGATASAIDSGIKNLKIDVDGPGGAAPLAMNNVAPNTRVDLSEAAFGPGSYVELRRERLSTTYPPPGTPLGTPVSYAADVLEITMIRVHVTDRTPSDPTPTDPLRDIDVATDVVISSSDAHSESNHILCQAAQAVEGHATILRGNVGNLVGAGIGTAGPLPSAGGASHQELEGFTVGDPALAKGGVSVSHTEGRWGPTSSTASSFARVAGLCVDLPVLPAACDISADAILSQVSSTASAASRTSTGNASFVNLMIAGQAVNPSPGALQDVKNPVTGETIALVAVNERTCDGTGTLGADSATCTTPAGGTKTAMTVRALRITITNVLPANPFGLTLGSEIVIGEAHSGATFVSVS